ncbi:MAG: ferredoxin--NADP+ reductase [Chloroflexi bacterium]|nr:MAG: ferredoxin--NADP+ reductase [Chloroflexota bacterium]
MADLPIAKIVERKELSEDLWIVKLKPEIDYTFKPGQYVTIGSEGIERPYSIASAPYEPFIELFVELVPPPDGNLTPILHRLDLGETVTMRPRAKGIFTLEPAYQDHLMVATVTGVAPYISMIRQYLHEGGSGLRFFVLEGASYTDEFGYDDELMELERDHPDTVKFLATISRPAEKRNASWAGETGRVNTLVEKYLAAYGLERENTLVHLCGHPGMIEDAKERLTPAGWNVKEERFWKD